MVGHNPAEHNAPWREAIVGSRVPAQPPAQAIICGSRASSPAATRTQRVAWPGATSALSIGGSVQRATMCGQRGANGQPAGMARGSGGIPAIAVSRLPRIEPGDSIKLDFEVIEREAE